MFNDCHLFKVYQKNGKTPIPYFQLVIDPTNMMYTFDNTFQVSFLFRDGMIAFVKGDEGLPAIKPMSENAKLKKPSENTSFVSTLDHKLIQVRLILELGIQQHNKTIASIVFQIEIHQEV